jgi:hypothetical protein
MCACGCGERVIWSKSFYRWNSYVLGHEGRVRFKTQDFHVNVRMKCSRPHKGKTPKKECIQCKIIFPATYKEKKYCSMACRTLHQRGENHPLYKENRSKYVASRIKNVSKDSINVHILKMEALLNRRLNSTEVVHHIDENKENNSIDNLFLFHCDSCHRHFHSLFSNDKNAELKYKYEDFHKTQKPKSRVYKRHNYTIKDIPNSILAEVLIYMRNKESTSTSNSCDIGGVP